MATKNVTQNQLYKLLGVFFFGLAVVCALAAAGSWAGYNFATTQVHSQLAQEKITFPKAGPSFDVKTYPGLQQYAGQAVDNGVKAKAYADEYIWVHMMKASGGKTYAQVSSESMSNPSDTKLSALKNTLFQGDMLRSSLLTAYAFSVFGNIASYALPIAIVAATVSLLAGLFLLMKARRS